MKHIFSRRFRKRASSLIVTLLVIVVLSTIVVAFMQSMSIERKTAKIIGNSYRAKLVAEAGMRAAIRQIALGVNSNQAYIVGQTNDVANFGPVLVIGQTNLTNSSQLMPLMSGNLASLSGSPSASSNAVTAYINARTNTASSSSINVNLRNTLIEVTSDTNKYRAPWTYLTNSDGTTNGRYAYIVLDEWARVNPRYHGDTNLSRSNSTNWFPGVGVLPLYSGGTNLLSTAEAAAARNVATNTSPSPLTPLTVGQAFASRTAYDARKHLLTLNEAWSPDVIPAGLPEGGKPKYNINDLSTNSTYGTPEARANRIADIINSNLTNFKARDPSLAGTNQIKYLRRLGACIVDYIDSDSEITTVNGGEPAGRDLFPLVTAIAHRLQLTSLVTNAPASATLDSQFFVQVWNPYTAPVTITNTRLVIHNQIQPTFGTALKFPIPNYDRTNAASVTVRPNEMVVLTFPNAVGSWSGSSPDAAPLGVQFPGSADTVDGTWPYFRFFINAQVVDQNRRAPTDDYYVSGLAYASKGITDLNMHWECFFAQTPSPAILRFVGDPRLNFLSNYDWVNVASDANYASGTRWQGRQQATSARWQEFQTSWRNRDFVRTPPPSGNAPLSASVLPSAVVSSYATSNAGDAVSVIRNSPMQSIGELGNVYDEAQVADDLNAPPNIGTPGSPFSSGGGRTLRIGQPEFVSSNANVSWSTNGKRAVELLDLFTVNTTNAISTNYPVVQGRINMNTAPQAVLEALFYGITLSSDNLYSNSVITNISTLAQSIITNRPFNKLSDIYKITPGLINATNYSPALGTNLATNSANLYPQAPVFDRAREEALGKLVELCTVQSRSFRIFIVGQSLGPNLKRQGQVAVEASVKIQDSGGTMTPIITYQREEN